MLEQQWVHLLVQIMLEKLLKLMILFLVQWQVVQLIVNFGKSMLLCNVEFMNLEMVRNHQLLWLQ